MDILNSTITADEMSDLRNGKTIVVELPMEEIGLAALVGGVSLCVITNAWLGRTKEGKRILSVTVAKS